MLPTAISRHRSRASTASPPTDGALGTAIDALADRIAPDLRTLREQLHQHPELAFEEHRTAELVADRLGRLGWDVRTGLGRTGVAGVLGAGLGGPCVALRADMDALPIHEATGLLFASAAPGRMHACGHDVHTAVALGVAEVLARLKDHLTGPVKLVFQPAEEILQGARAVITDGVLDAPPTDAILGFHVAPELEAGTVGYTPDVAMAAAFTFDIELLGRAGHAAHPHQAIDALVGASQVVMGLQTVISREVAPLVPAVVTVGQIQGGTARNVVADKVTLRGTVRVLDADAGRIVESALKRIVEGICSATRLAFAFDWQELTPVLKQHPAILAKVVAAAEATLGPAKVLRLAKPSMGSEDFAVFAERVPAAHLRLGARIPGLETALHQANFDVHEDTIATGVRVLCAALFALMEHPGQATALDIAEAPHA